MRKHKSLSLEVNRISGKQDDFGKFQRAGQCDSYTG
jgi:hypothetical protein